MTEPAKNMAVEDVLTSIRRLLAQDGSKGGDSTGAEDQMSIEHTLAALEAAMASRIAPPTELTDESPAADAAEAPAGKADVPEAAEKEAAAVPEALALSEVTSAASEAEEVDEAPFIAVDMPGAPPSPSFSFRHTAEIRRLQLVTPEAVEPQREVVESGAPPAPEVMAEAFPAPSEVEGDIAAEAPPAKPVPPEPIVTPPVEESAAPPVAAGTPRTRMARRESEEPRSLFHEPDELPIDREMLRTLIGEVLREELQGTLGERMTRNVRKLVRAEIRRALAEGEAD